MNKRALGIVATTALAIAALAAPAAAAPAPKTTGDVWADQIGGVQAHMVFVAQDTSPAKGSFTYTDPNGTYTVAVEDVRIVGSEGDFAGRVVSSTFSWLVAGQYLGVAVLDGGEPGVDVDKVIGAIYPDLATAKAGYDSLSPASASALVASAGNLQVR